jgi:spore germination protein YaaH
LDRGENLQTPCILLQLWFDDEESLSAKYELAGSTGARGVAIWTADIDRKSVV